MKLSSKTIQELIKSDSIADNLSLRNEVLAVPLDRSPARDNTTDEESTTMMLKPDFKIGSVTKVYAQTLGPLAALSRYNMEPPGKNRSKETSKSPDMMARSGTEEHSSFEQMWDD